MRGKKETVKVDKTIKARALREQRIELLWIPYGKITWNPFIKWVLLVNPGIYVPGWGDLGSKAPSEIFIGVNENNILSHHY